jgi:AraC family transcriptional regulator, transcriptional activator of pobA
MEKELPIYSINKFNILNNEGDFYANFLNQHVKHHHFTHFPHRHDFFLVILFTKGKGKHEVDFKTFKVEKGALFILKPGQMHYWELSDDTDGFIFFHSREFFDKDFLSLSIKDFHFYNSFQGVPYFKLKENQLSKISLLMHEIVAEYTKQELLKWQKIHALIVLTYIEISREKSFINAIKNQTYLAKLRQFEDVIEANYSDTKSVKDYANKLNITEKHLNRITKSCLGKTSTQLISERIVLEAKRMLIYSKLNVSQIGAELGYFDNAYFIRFFKRNTGITPYAFLTKYKVLK